MQSIPTKVYRSVCVLAINRNGVYVLECYGRVVPYLAIDYKILTFPFSFSLLLVIIDSCVYCRQNLDFIGRV